MKSKSVIGALRQYKQPVFHISTRKNSPSKRIFKRVGIVENQTRESYLFHLKLVQYAGGQSKNIK